MANAEGPGTTKIDATETPMLTVSTIDADCVMASSDSLVAEYRSNHTSISAINTVAITSTYWRDRHMIADPEIIAG